MGCLTCDPLGNARLLTVAILNKAAVDVRDRLLCGCSHPFSGTMPSVTAGLCISVCLVFIKKLANPFPEVLYYFTFPPATEKDF